MFLLSRPAMGVIDKYRIGKKGGSSVIAGKAVANPLFTANAAGTTTTMVGAAAALTTSTNCARLSERFVLMTSAGVLKEETVFEVTAHNGTTTITFTPAAAAATASGDIAMPVSMSPWDSNDSLDERLIAAGGVYTQTYVDKMTQNDKVYAIRQLDNADSVK